MLFLILMKKRFFEIHGERAVGIKFDPVLADFITLYLLFSMNRPHFIFIFYHYQ